MGLQKLVLAVFATGALMMASAAAWSEDTAKSNVPSATPGRSAHDSKAETAASEKGTVHSGADEKAGRAAHDSRAESHAGDQHVGTQSDATGASRGDHTAKHRNKRAKKKSPQPAQ